MLRKLKKAAKKRYNPKADHRRFTVWLRRKGRRHYNEPVLEQTEVTLKPNPLHPALIKDYIQL
jgi:hypothetical protein